MSKIENVPTNLITGALGVGKTSAILDLLANQTSNTRWAILVNEFGEIPIDGAVMETDGVYVRDVPGGCLCCSVGVPMQIALVMLLRQARPDRLLIELSGMGHPGQVIDTLKNMKVGEALDLRATLCLVDPRDLEDDDILQSQIFQDQIHLSDVLIANKTDLAGKTRTEEFMAWGKNLFPQKRRIVTTKNGHLNPEWLDEPTDPLRTPLFPDAHNEAREHHHHQQEDPLPLLMPGRPFKKESAGLNRHACGWIFSPHDVFHQDRLRHFFAQEAPIQRLKGVFNIGTDWVLFNRINDELTEQSVAYRRDSRMECIAQHPLDWATMEKSLLTCLKK